MESGDLDVTYVAKLARLRLTEVETKLFQEQLGHVLEYAGQLRQVDVSGVETAAHVSPIFNVLRPDEARGGLSAAEALRNAPRQANDLFVITKVLE